jgi:hypothetical protein
VQSSLSKLPVDWSGECQLGLNKRQANDLIEAFFEVIVDKFTLG